MSISTLDRPAPAVRIPSPRGTVHHPTPSTGSYVDTAGVRRTPAVSGSYTATASGIGAYTGRRPTVAGSYLRTER